MRSKAARLPLVLLFRPETYNHSTDNLLVLFTQLPNGSLLLMLLSNPLKLYSQHSKNSAVLYSIHRMTTGSPTIYHT